MSRSIFGLGMIRKLIARVGRELARLRVRRRTATGWLLRKAFRIRYGDQPVEATKLMAMGRLVGSPNPLWELSQAPATGRRIRHPRLATAFTQTELGHWTLHPD